MTVAEADLPLLTGAIHPAVLVDVRAAAGVGSSEPCRVVDRRMAPGEASHVLFEAGGRHVVGSIVDGRLSLAPIEADGALPGLASLHDRNARQRLVERWLPPLASGTARHRLRLLRYRPGRRATFLLSRTAIGPARSLVRHEMIVKLYHDAAKAQAVHEEMSALAGNIRPAGLVLARPAGFDPGLAIVAQEVVSGRPLAALVEAEHPQAEVGAAAAASGLAALHELTPITHRSRPLRHTVEKLRRRANALASLHPSYCRPLVELADRLRVAADRFADPAAERWMIHGDTKADQFLLRPDGVALLDFDHCGIGDPAADLADFAAKIRQRSLASGRPSPPAAHSMSEAFLGSYYAASRPDSTLSTRVAVHLSVALGRRALRSYQRAPTTRLGPRLIADANDSLDRLYHGDSHR